MNGAVSRDGALSPRPVVVVTRPEASGRRLCDRIAERQRAIWWPAFVIGAAPNIEAAQSALRQLADYDLAIFVSANAVRAVGRLLGLPWPAGTVIGAVGAATRAAIETELPQATGAAVVAPDTAGESGSEAFWAVWEARAPARRVLLLRAEDGRDWLAERFAESGAQVDSVAVYTRRVRCWTSADAAQLHDCIVSGVAPLVVFSSSEAIAALDRQVGADGQVWLRTGTALASHPRIAEYATAHGYARVCKTGFDDDSILAKIEFIGSHHEC